MRKGIVSEDVVFFVLGIGMLVFILVSIYLRQSAIIASDRAAMIDDHAMTVISSPAVAITLPIFVHFFPINADNGNVGSTIKSAQ